MAAVFLRQYINALISPVTMAFNNALSNLSAQVATLSAQQKTIETLSCMTVVGATTPMTLTSGNASGTYTAPISGGGNLITLSPLTLLSVKGVLLGSDIVTQDSGIWDLDFVVKQGQNAVVTTIVGTPNITLSAADTAFSSLTISVVADTVDGAFYLEVSNSAGWTNIASFQATLSLTELTIS